MSGFVLPSLVKKSESQTDLGDEGVTIASQRCVSPIFSPMRSEDGGLDEMSDSVGESLREGADLQENMKSLNNSNPSLRSNSVMDAKRGRTLSIREKELLMQSFLDIPEENDDTEPVTHTSPQTPQNLRSIVEGGESVGFTHNRVTSLMDSFEVIDDLTCLPDIQRRPELSESAWKEMFDSEGVCVCGHVCVHVCVPVCACMCACACECEGLLLCEVRKYKMGYSEMFSPFTHSLLRLYLDS